MQEWEKAMTRIEFSVCLLCVLGIIGLLGSPQPLPAQPVVPAGDEFVVNSFTFGRQWRHDVSMTPDGSFVVMWTDGSNEPGLTGQDGSFSGVRGQRFDATGGRIGSEFQVNITTFGSQQFPLVGHDAAGNLLAVWSGIMGRRYDASFVPIGGEFLIAPGLSMDRLDVAVQPNGDFVIAHGGPPFGDVMGLRFQPDGMPIGAEFEVTTSTNNTQAFPSVAVDNDGDFVVVWESDDIQFLHYNVKAQRFDSEGTMIGQEFQVNTFSTFRQWHSDVDMDSEGNFVVVWHSQKSTPPDDSSLSAIQAQRYASDGSPIGGEFQVNTTTQALEDFPQVSVEEDGSFMVVWETSKTPGDVDGWNAIAAQQFDTDGNKVGSEFLVNSYTPLTQDQPKIAGDGMGRFVVVWSDSGIAGYNLAEQDGSLNGVFGQRFENPIFADGFESGDTTVWSSTQ